MLKQEVTAHLQSKLLPFWKSLLDKENGGFYGYMGNDLTVDRQAPKGLILNSRILWFFSRAVVTLGDQALLPYATQAYEFLKCFLDTENGGLYWSLSYDGKPLDTMKHTYAQAFAIYGLSQYALACGSKEALAFALSLYELIESRMSDAGGYGEAFNADFSPADNARLSDNPVLMSRGIVATRTMNTMLHVMEAYTTLFEASGDQRVRHSLTVLLDKLIRKVYNPAHNRLEVFFDGDMNSLLDMQSFGHDIEASWLIDLAAQAVYTGADLARVQKLTQELALGVLDRAYRDGFLMNEQVEGQVDDRRIWWVQAESMVGFCNLSQKVNTDEPLLAVETIWRSIQEHLVDKRSGSEWFESVDSSGVPSDKPIVDPWKCPYHNGRMCMELIARL